MENIQKMIGAAHGGLVSGSIVTAGIVGTIVPTGTSLPWWGYLVIWIAANVVTCLFPALATYLAPANQPKPPVQ